MPGPLAVAEALHPYPLVRSGGLFLICVGTGFLLGWIFPKRLTIHAVAGGAIAVIATGLTAVPLALGRPTMVHIVALAGAVVVEFALIALVLSKLRHGDDRSRMLSILWVVGFHFVIMGLAFGPLIAVLGILAMANATIGALVPTMALRIAGALDGLLKIAFGVWMLVFHPAVTYW